MKNDEYYMKLAYKEALKAYKKGEIPVGAIIVKDGIIIGKGYNTREKDSNILGHAEINAIINASKKINNWNLSDSEMYVTLKPCSMCMEIIKQSRIKNVNYLLDKPDHKKEFYKTKFKKIDENDYNDEYLKILQSFFKKLREK